MGIQLLTSNIFPETHNTSSKLQNDTINWNSNIGQAVVNYLLNIPVDSFHDMLNFESVKINVLQMFLPINHITNVSYSEDA